VNLSATALTPIDRVRWPAVFAGLFSALSAMIVLTVLGSAIGLSAYDQGDNPRFFAVGAGWWAAISALLAFAFGGWVAARTSAVRGGTNGMINGAMVWAAAIPLSLVVFAGSLTSLTGAAANSAAAASSQIDRQDLTDQARLARDRITGQLNDPRQSDEMRRTGAKTAWATLASLVLGLAAAGAGGYFGARQDDVVTGPSGHTTSTGTAV
jgi:hypothetical protein